MYKSPRLFVTYTLAYLLLMEWLLPLPTVTDTGFMPVFVAESAFFFIVMFFGIPWWGRILLIGTSILFGLHLIFFDTPFLREGWRETFWSDFVQNAGYLMSGDWFQFSDLFRSFLFLFLLAIMSYLIYFWVIHARRILFFFAFTIIYIGVIDTFSSYDGKVAIVRAFLLGFVLLALLQWDRLSLYFPGTGSRKIWLRWFAISLLLLSAAAGAGALLPKADPQWPDPVPYLKAATGVDEDSILGKNAPRRIGYGDNDKQLGGGFAMDDTLVFTAVGEQSGYWRGESKNRYTGSGWERDTPHESGPESSLYEEGTVRKEQEMTVKMNGDWSFPFVFYPGSLKKIATEEKVVHTEVDRYSGKASTFLHGEPYHADEYELMFEKGIFPIENMKQADAVDPVFIKEHYLSLPEDFPSSVQTLAENLTIGKENRYDKVRAIESFFHGPDFTYDTKDVPVPEKGEDYVTQFLFETRRGYCDNFSTSMAVMLRTLDIPTRWVKGFTTGEEVGQKNGKTIYEITNANAHSWVEVYFPEVGWVPFEPTHGFSADFDYTVGTADNEEKDADEKEKEEQEKESEADKKETDDGAAVPIHGLLNWPILLGAVAVITGVFLFRMPLLKRLILLRYQRSCEPVGMTKAYYALLWILRRAGMKKKQNETLREFSRRVDGVLKTEDMTRLTYEFEKMHYGKYTGKTGDFIVMWKNVIRSIKA
nr:transglutaminase domain-containing protein [Bacillus piscicola]